MSGIPLFSGPSATNYASARYAPANTQTQANDNDCDTGSPQTQGDGSASSPTNLQISGPTEEQELEPPLVPNTFHIFVRTQVICPAGKVCPNVEDFRYHVVFSDAVSFSNPKEWRGSTIQQVFLITQTDRPDWQVVQTNPPTPKGLFLTTHTEGECTRQFQTCTFINEYTVGGFADIFVRKFVICPREFIVVCPIPEDFQLRIAKVPESGGPQFIVNPQTALGSREGTLFQLGWQGDSQTFSYRVVESGPPTPEGLILNATVGTVPGHPENNKCGFEDVGQAVESGGSLRCDIVNEYVVGPSSTS